MDGLPTPTDWAEALAHSASEKRYHLLVYILSKTLNSESLGWMRKREIFDGDVVMYTLEAEEKARSGSTWMALPRRGALLPWRFWPGFLALHSSIEALRLGFPWFRSQTLLDDHLHGSAAAPYQLFTYNNFPSYATLGRFFARNFCSAVSHGVSNLCLQTLRTMVYRSFHVVVSIRRSFSQLQCS